MIPKPLTKIITLCRACLSMFVKLTFGLVIGTTYVQSEDFLITNAKVYSLTDKGVLNNTDIYVSDGYVMDVGHKLKPQGRYQTIDAAGRSVTPGFINSTTQLGLVEISAASSTVDYTTTHSSHKASFSIYSAINMFSTLIPHNRINGLTRAIVTPSNHANVFQGSGAAVALLSSDNGLLRDNVAQYVNYGVVGSKASGGSRASAYATIDKALQEANYLRNNRSRFGPGYDWHFSQSIEDLDALKLVLERKIPLVVNVNRRSDILQIVKLADKHSVNLIISGGAEAWTVADKLARAKIPVLMDPMLNVPESFESLAIRSDAAAILSKSGVDLIFGFASSHNAYLVRQSAGNAIANGLSEQQALKALTVNPARYFGIENYGTISIGMEADLVVWDGEPFEVTTNPDVVIIKGERQPMASRATRLRDRYWSLKNIENKAFLTKQNK
jgi:imidazolonepropionase-like amidohydrolase